MTASGDHHVVASFLDQGHAAAALAALRRANVPDEHISFVGRHPDPGAPAEDQAAPALREVPPEMAEAGEVSGRVAKGVAAGGTAGTAAGGLAGFLAGAVAFGIPGIGPAVGAGIWAAVAGGAAAGATAGGMIGGFRKVWELRYRDAVREGQVVLSVHSDDRSEIERAAAALDGAGPARFDRFDTGAGWRAAGGGKPRAG